MSSENNAIEGQLPFFALKDVFKLVKDLGTNIQVQCLLCLPKTNLLSTGKATSSNLRKHMKVSEIVSSC